MAEVSDIKNAARGVGQAASAVVKYGGLSFFKAFFDGSKSKIDNWSAFFMVFVAICLDILQVILSFADGGTLTGPAIMIIQMGMYTVWFFFKGVSYWNMRAVVSKIISGLGELIPVINDFIPSTTVMIIAAIGVVRLEEAGVPVSGAAGTEKKGGEEVKQPARKAPENQQEQNQEGIKNPKRSGDSVKLDSEERA